MTVKQIVLRFIYPVFRKYSRLKNRNSGLRTNTGNAASFVSFYSLEALLINKMPFDFSSLKGKKVLLVNVASNCGFTAQYEELEKLSRLYKPALVVLAFPANDFKGQEPGSDEEIETFCRNNYHVSFQLFTRASVIRPGQQQVFEWLCNKDKNGWNDQSPSWNFCKYLVDEEGNLQYVFQPSISPLSEMMLKAIETPILSSSGTTR